VGRSVWHVEGTCLVRQRLMFRGEVRWGKKEAQEWHVLER
jgi:hypothetical protein